MYILGAQKNHLNEMVLVSTNNHVLVDNICNKFIGKFPSDLEGYCRHEEVLTFPTF